MGQEGWHCKQEEILWMERGNQGHCPRHQKAMSKLLSVCPDLLLFLIFVFIFFGIQPTCLHESVGKAHGYRVSFTLEPT